MAETFFIEIKMPEFMSLMKAEARKRILEEVNARIKDQVAELTANAAQEVVTRILEEIDKKMEIKSSLEEEILSLPAEDAIRKLKLSLAIGEIDEDIFHELKALVDPKIKIEKKKKSIPKEIHIRVMTPFDEETIVEISSDATVGELLEKAASKLQINPRDYAIMFQGEIVPSQEFLSDVGIEPEYAVYVVRNPQGG